MSPWIKLLRLLRTLTLMTVYFQFVECCVRMRKSLEMRARLELAVKVNVED